MCQCLQRNELVKVSGKIQIRSMTNNGISEIKARFDKVAAEWDSNPGRVELAKAVGAAIRKAVPLRSDMKVMDFGAGTGLLTLALLPYISSLMAVDASTEMLRVLDQKLTTLQIGNVRTLLCDFTETPLPVAEFDLIVSSMVLHHISDVQQMFRRLQPCLRLGGRIAMADLDSEDGTFHPDPTGVFHHGLDRSKVCEWLENAGFVDVVSQDAYSIKRPSASGGTKQYGVFLVTGRVN